MIYKVITTPEKIRLIIHNRKTYVSTKKRKKRNKIFSNYNYTSILRAIQTIRLLCETNINQHVSPDTNEQRETLFVTFTFKENLTDLKKANLRFRNFNQNLARFITQERNPKRFIKYLAVPEFQKRGAVHYHVLYFNLPYIPSVYDVFNKLWGHGWVIFRKVDRFTPKEYLIKDLSKKLDFSFNQKRYFTSRGLFKPDIKRYTEMPPDLKLGHLTYQNFRKTDSYEVTTEVYTHPSLDEQLSLF